MSASSPGPIPKDAGSGQSRRTSSTGLATSAFHICLLFGIYRPLCGSDTVGVRVPCITRLPRPQPCGRGAMRASLNHGGYPASTVACVTLHNTTEYTLRLLLACLSGDGIPSNDQVTHTVSLTPFRPAFNTVSQHRSTLTSAHLPFGPGSHVVIHTATPFGNDFRLHCWKRYLLGQC